MCTKCLKTKHKKLFLKLLPVRVHVPVLNHVAILRAEVKRILGLRCTWRSLSLPDLFFFCFPSALWEATVRSRANGIPFRGLFLKMLTKFPFARIPIFMALCLFFKLRFPFSTMNPSRNRAFTCFLTPHSKTVFILTFSLEKPKKKSSQVVCERQWNYMSVENCSHPPRFLNHS